MGRTGRAAAALRGPLGVVLALALVISGLAVAVRLVPRSAVEGVVGPAVGLLLGRPTETYDDAAARAAAGEEPVEPVPSPEPGGSAAGTAEPAPESREPLRLRVEAWDREFAVVDVARRAGGALVPPDDVATLGRWDEGARPGDGIGTVVLVVHRDSAEQGRGPFARLEDLPQGARVTLGGRRYRLDSVRTYAKTALPAARVFGQSGSERLVVVTCGGRYSATRGWDSNVVATFLPVRA